MATSHIAAETSDVILAADALPGDSLAVMLQVFAGQAGNRANTGAEREMFHSLARLLAAIRDNHESDWQALKRSARRPRGVEPVRA